MRARLAVWAYRRLVAPMLLGYIGRKGSDMYTYRPEDVELIFHGR